MSAKILWADDEIELLKPHVLFLEQKGYEVSTVTNGGDAVDQALKGDFDIIFLDENMPGVSGIEALSKIKASNPSVPVIMITKSEEETIMEEAIGSKISDYLIKPVNPNQILLSVKKNLDDKRLISEKTTSGYQQEFREIGMSLSDRLDSQDWGEMYRKLVYWDLELETSEDKSMEEVYQMQKSEANRQFSRFVADNYKRWINKEGDDIPLMSHNLIKEKVVPHLENGQSTFLVVIDNLRLDQFKILSPILERYFRTEADELYYSILPTATQYARNSLFAGLMPADIEKLSPEYWVSEDEDKGKNLHEEELLAAQLKRLGKQVKFSYHKITNLNAGKKLSENFQNLLSNDLNVIVYNFVDMLSHARTDMEVIRELAEDDAAYRSLTLSWFEHSPLFEIMRQIAENKGRMILTTDHGTILVKHPVKVIGDRNTNTNLRYKQGKNLNYKEKEVFSVAKPEDIRLPRTNVSTSYIFAIEDTFFVYPNNYNYYVNFFKNTFQHGGISLEEVIIPCVTYKAR